MSTKKYSKSAEEPSLKSFGDHLGELRGRLAWVAVVFIVASALAYNIREQLVSVVLSPIGDQTLVYLTPAGGFAFIFQVTMYAGMLATAPVAIFHLYRFVSPALPEHVRANSIWVVACSTLLMMMGVGFGYFVAIPAALQFLTAFAGDFVEASLTADSYLSFVVAYVLGLGLLFQLPLFLVFWNWVKPFQPGGLLATQRFVLVGAFIAAAMITPTPDVLNQCLIAVPIVAVYQLGVIAVYIMNRTRRRQEARIASVSDIPQLPNNFGEQSPPAALYSQQLRDDAPPVLRRTVAPEVTPSPSLVQEAISKPAPTVDGFSRVRTSSLGVPARQHRYSRPSAVRPPVVSTAERQLRRAATSIDGFTFV